MNPEERKGGETGRQENKDRQEARWGQIQQDQKKGGKKEKMKMLHRGQKGFTLIELLIVVAILGILAAVIIPNVSAFMRSARVSAANDEVQQVRTAAMAYYADNEAYPASSDTLITDGYLAGQPRATYTLDTSFGWVLGAPTHTWGTTITFQAGTAGADGTHGRWVIAP